MEEGVRRGGRGEGEKAEDSGSGAGKDPGGGGGGKEMANTQERRGGASGKNTMKPKKKR